MDLHRKPALTNLIATIEEGKRVVTTADDDPAVVSLCVASFNTDMLRLFKVA